LQSETTRNVDRAVSGGIAPAEISVLSADAPHSMAEMAQRDLDAALQLLAFRAQYITGASGAAIALRREGRKDMLCRASTGSNAPELGALLSTEYGLSGESVRTRQLLRCDDAERDSRVNREVCRRLGIASVVVMPVVSDDGVLGVFELFSGKAHAFGERDVSAVQRLSEMVETAVRLAHVTQTLPERLKADPSSAAAATSSEEKILDEGTGDPPLAVGKAEDEQIIDVDLNDSIPAIQATDTPPVKAQTAPQNLVPAPAALVADAIAPKVEAGTVEKPASPPADAIKELPAGVALKDSELSVKSAQSAVPQRKQEAPPRDGGLAAVSSPPPAPEASAAAKPRFWSAAEQAGDDKSADADQSHVPPVLRGLRKCEVCGFPISGGRVLCVECEEKKWRGQLKQSMPTGALPASAPTRKPEVQAFAAAAQATSGSGAANYPRTSPANAVPPAKALEPKDFGRSANQSTSATGIPERKAGPQLVVNHASISATPLFSAGLEPSQSWFARNKYVIGALVLIAAAVAAVFLFR
jgi:hypothetical protein